VQRLWIWALPFIFLPNLGMTLDTQFGRLDLADFLLLPFLLIVVMTKKSGRVAQYQSLSPLFFFFLFWAILGLMAIPFSYGYSEPLNAVYFGLLKLGKMFLYIYVGMAIVRILANHDVMTEYHWALIFAGLIVASGLTAYGFLSREQYHLGSTLYKASNMMSVTLGILTVYIATLRASGYGSRLWRTVSLFSLPAMAVGLSFSSGRGGWLAVGIGLLYYVFKRPHRTSSAVMGMGIVAIVATIFWFNPQFQTQIEMTLNRDQEYLQAYNIGVLGIDDGSRVYTWTHEVKKLIDAPFLGTGLFHRGGQSGLWWTGSHNFWIQILLETGIVGAVIWLMLALRIWRQANLPHVRSQVYTLPAKSALIVAAAGGMSGEYFYGSLCLLMVFLVYSPIGSAPAKSSGSTELSA
jgi:O-antigen ligase